MNDFKRRSVRCILEAPRLIIEPFKGLHLLGVAKLRILDRRFENANGLVVDLDGFGQSLAATSL